MFGRLFKYSVLQSLRSREIMFWILLFPMILGTLFNLTFGNYSKNVESFRAIPVAYVEEDGKDTYFWELLKSLQEGEGALLTLKETSLNEAKDLLREGEVKGIFRNGDGISMMVKENGINESILKMVLEEYEKKQSVIQNIALAHPEKLEEALDGLEVELNLFQEQSLTDGNMDLMMSYFYALMAMSCLYGSFMGLDGAKRFKANQSDIAARRVVASTNRFMILIADITSKIFLQFSCSLLAMAYLALVLKVDFVARLPQVLLVILAGSTVGVMTGMCIGSVGRGKQIVKEAISVAFTMFECFLSGLMIEGMYYVIEEHAPILNRINPAALIVDSFYSLNIYDTYTRYLQNVAGLVIIALILMVISFLAVRRERYASL